MHCPPITCLHGPLVMGTLLCFIFIFYPLLLLLLLRYFRNTWIILYYRFSRHSTLVRFPDATELTYKYTFYLVDISMLTSLDQTKTIQVYGNNFKGEPTYRRVLLVRACLLTSIYFLWLFLPVQRFMTSIVTTMLTAIIPWACQHLGSSLSRAWAIMFIHFNVHTSYDSLSLCNVSGLLMCGYMK